jgi:hypothetical protein
MTPEEKQKQKQDMLYTEYLAVHAEGQRIGLATCKRCGATVIVGVDGFSAVRQHDEFHRWLDQHTHNWTGK